jgi:hypothetical protein
MEFFSREEFGQVLGDIEKYLGYLRGNENAYQYMRDVEKGLDGSGSAPTILDVIPWEGYGYPCPEERFKVKPALPLNVYVGEGFDREQFIKDVKESMDASWNNGVAWSAGIKDYAVSVCDLFTKPSVTMLTSAIETMQTQVGEARPRRQRRLGADRGQPPCELDRTGRHGLQRLLRQLRRRPAHLRDLQRLHQLGGRLHGWAH